MPDRKFRLATNRHLVDKNVAGRPDLYVYGWENVERTITEIAKLVSTGVAFTAQLTGRRKSANFFASDVVAVDIDRGVTIEQALEHPIVKQHAGLIYTTASHKPDAHRFRIVFPTPRTITDPSEMRALTRSLALRLSGDPAAVDATRISFGARGAQTWIYEGRELSSELLDELIAQSICPPVTDKATGGALAAARSALKIKPEQMIRLAGGMTLPFSRVPSKAQVHCPFHADEHASAHVVISQRGAHGLHCAACAQSYWPADGADDFDFLDFDRAVRQAHENFELHRDWGPLGPVLNSSAAKIGLLGCNIVITDGEPAPPELLRGLTLIKAPKGSGKTESLKSLIARSRKVLLIGHRRSLIRQSCKRLDLCCYLDPSGTFDRVGVCLDSLEFIPRDCRYDVVILDESEQVLAHFLSDTIEQRQGGGRERLFNRFSTLVLQTKRVVALDADLGFVTLSTLKRMMAPALPDPVQGDLFESDRPRVRLWLNEGKPGQGKTIQVFRSKSHLIADLTQVAAEGKRVFVTANSKTLVNDIAAMIAERLPQARQIVITADTVSGEAQKAFLENARERALDYDVILTSPAVGTGVDISFPDKAQLIDAVFGICEANITTHMDFDQQLARVRDPGVVRVWVNPRRFHYETSPDVVRRELLEQSVFKNLLVDHNGPGGTARYVEDDPLIEMAALIISQQRASKNALRDHFITHKQWQGFVVEVVEPNDDLKATGRELIDEGRRLGHEKYVQRMLAAPPLRPRDFTRVTEAIEGGQVVADGEWWSHQRTKIELFYRQPITAELVELDGRGRYRARAMLFQDVERAAAGLNSARAQEPLDRRLRFLRERDDPALAIARLMQLTPVMQCSAWNAGVEIDGGQLEAFARFAVDNKAAIENLLGIEVRRDLETKPMSQLKAVLRLIGLDLTNAGTTKIAGRKIYRYRLDDVALQRIKALLAAREKTTGWRYLAELHGWPDDEADADEKFNDAA
jgi:hypothetical protein